LNAQKAKNGHSDRSRPTHFPQLRSCEVVVLRSGGLSLRFIAQAKPLSFEVAVRRRTRHPSHPNHPIESFRTAAKRRVRNLLFI
jgi:hypothetical protein